jgi:biotin transport system substrate-specific component
MARSSAVAQSQPASLKAVRQVAVIVGASLFMALCARLSLPLPFTPVPLTLANFGVIAVGLALGSRRGFAALALYLAEGAAGLPVFATGLGGIAYLLGPTGGYLMAYPAAAFVAGWIAERGRPSFVRFAAGALAAEVVVFAGGVGWLMMLTHGATQAMRFGLYPFVFAEIIKVMAAAGLASRLRRKQLLAIGR